MHCMRLPLLQQSPLSFAFLRVLAFAAQRRVHALLLEAAKHSSMSAHGIDLVATRTREVDANGRATYRDGYGHAVCALCPHRFTSAESRRFDETGCRICEQCRREKNRHKAPRAITRSLACPSEPLFNCSLALFVYVCMQLRIPLQQSKRMPAPHVPSPRTRMSPEALCTCRGPRVCV
jgi:hypothetical protein